MHTVIRSGEIEPNEWGTIKFEGEPYGSGASFFLVNNQPGEGPGLHKHRIPRRGSSDLVTLGSARGIRSLKQAPVTSWSLARTRHTSSRTSVPSASTSSASTLRPASSKRIWSKDRAREVLGQSRRASRRPSCGCGRDRR